MMDAAGKGGPDEASGMGVESTTEGLVTVDIVKKTRWKRRVTLIGGFITLIAAGIVLPPLVNIGRYQHQVTALMSRSMGRPVHLSSVGLRLLPRPGFVLNDLSVSEDPNFGVEPILSARTVVASVAIVSLWRGELQIDRVSVDDASLNLVRDAQGRWNLESLMMGAQPRLMGRSDGSAGLANGAGSNRPKEFPYLEATNSRVNLKNGIVKSPFSIVGTDLSLWQDDPGRWRVRVKGQPVRTDMEMSLADTGEVRMEATLRATGPLRDMPLKLQVEWRDAQLGQLSRLLLGSDAGWRGDMTADIDVQGTPEAAITKARLRATGVRREEFTPETALDFDANCAFRYQHSQNAVHDLGCNTAIGDGEVHLKAEVPGGEGRTEAMLEVKQIPLQAGLDLLRTLRGGIAPGISAKGAINGSLTYKENEPVKAGKDKVGSRRDAAKVKAGAAKLGLGDSSLQGDLTVDGGSFKGGALKETLVMPKMIWTPTVASNSGKDGRFNVGLTSRFTIAPTQAAFSRSTAVAAVSSAGAAGQGGAPGVTVQVSLRTYGYGVALGGSAGAVKLRDLAYAFGLPHQPVADSLVDGTVDLNLRAGGPWIPSPEGVTVPSASLAPAGAKAKAASLELNDGQEAESGADFLLGSLQLRHAHWKPDYLLRSVELTQGSVVFAGKNVNFSSDFSYGGNDGGKGEGGDLAANKLKGSAEVAFSSDCTGNDCEPRVQLRFGAVDVAGVQAALMDAPKEKSLLAPLIDKMHSSDRPKWPDVALGIQADSLVFGPTTLREPVIRVRMKENEVLVESWEAKLMGGSAKGSGHFAWTADRPEYKVDAEFNGLDAAAVGSLLGGQWTGGPVSGNGSVRLSGRNAKELAASADGELHYAWLRGSIQTASVKKAAAAGEDGGKSAQIVSFDSWNGTARIRDGKIQLGANTLVSGKRKSAVAGTTGFGGPIRLIVEPAGKGTVASNGRQLSRTTRQPAVK
jgi:hypothetical protein